MGRRWHLTNPLTTARRHSPNGAPDQLAEPGLQAFQKSRRVGADLIWRAGCSRGLVPQPKKSSPGSCWLNFLGSQGSQHVCCCWHRWGELIPLGWADSSAPKDLHLPSTLFCSMLSLLLIFFTFDNHFFSKKAIYFNSSAFFRTF